MSALPSTEDMARLAKAITPAPQPEGEPVTLTYTNWRGETPCPCIDARKGYRAAQASTDQYRREGFQAGIAAAAQVLLDACPNPIFDQLKPALMGEVTERVGYTDEDGNEVYYDRPVSWDAMKEIIRAALRALKGDA